MTFVPQLSKGFGFLDMLADSFNRVIVMLTALILVLVTGILLASQVFLLLRNQTTIEFGLSFRKKPFQSSDALANVRSIFGSRWVTWVSPIHYPFPNIQTSVGSNLLPASKSAPKPGLEVVRHMIPHKI